MSKISLQPNASGAGTFSIVAPDSNTNRTLTLPDESGAVLSDSSTIDSNNLQSDVYKQDNILGTVSESNGVPTGAIIQRGSNVNGEFVRYADGTQICHINSVSAGINAGGEFSVPFPVDFAPSNRAACSFSMNDHSSVGGRDRAHFLTTRGTGAGNLGQWRVGNNSTSFTSWVLNFLAIGRWY